MARQLQEINSSGEITEVKIGGTAEENSAATMAEVNLKQAIADFEGDTQSYLESGVSSVMRVRGATAASDVKGQAEIQGMIDAVTNSKVGEAPTDGLAYRRKDGAWDASPSYSPVLDEQVDFIVTLAMQGSVVNLKPTADVVCTLPETATEAIDEGFSVVVYNQSDSSGVTIATQGTDVLKSHNSTLVVPPNSYCKIGKIEEGTSNLWYITIEQTLKTGGGGLYSTAAPEQITLIADNVWQEFLPSTFQESTILKDMEVTAAGRLKINVPDHGTHTVAVNMFVMTSLALPDQDQDLDISFWINGAIVPEANFVMQRASITVKQTLGLAFPYALVGFTNVPNGAEISMAIRSNQIDEDVLQNSFSMQVTSSCTVGLDS